MASGRAYTARQLLRLAPGGCAEPSDDELRKQLGASLAPSSEPPEQLLTEAERARRAGAWADSYRLESRAVAGLETAMSTLQVMPKQTDFTSLSLGYNTDFLFGQSANEFVIVDARTQEGWQRLTRPKEEQWFEPFLLDPGRRRLALNVRTQTEDELRVLDTSTGAVLLRSSTASLHPPLFGFTPGGEAFVWLELSPKDGAAVLHVLDPSTLAERFAVTVSRGVTAIERASRQYALRYAPAGALVLVTEGSHGWLVSLGSGKVRAFTGNYRTNAEFSPDGRHVAWSEPHHLLLWDVRDGTSKQLAHPGCNAFADGFFSPDGQLLAQGATPYGVCLWDVARGRFLTTFAGYSRTPGPASTRAIGPKAWLDDGKVLVADAGDSLQLWDVSQQTQLEIPGSGMPLGTFSRFARRGSLAVVLARDRPGTGSVLARIEEAHVTRTFPIPGCVPFGETGVFLTDHAAIVHCGLERQLTWVDLARGTLSRRALASGWPVQLQLTSDQRVLATSSGNFFDARNGELLPKSPGGTLSPTDLRWQGATSLEAMASGPGESETHRLKLSFEPTGLRFSETPESSRCASTGYAGFFELDDAIMACGFGTEVGPIPLRAAEVASAVVSADGRHVLLQQRQGQLALFTVDGGTLTLLPTGGGFAAFAGDRIYTSGPDAISVWDTSGRKLLTRPNSKRAGSLLGISTQFALSSQIHVAETPGTVAPLSLSLELRDLLTGQRTGSFEAATFGPLGSVAFGPNQQLAIADYGIVSGEWGQLGVSLFRVPAFRLQGDFFVDERVKQAIFRSPLGLFETSGPPEPWAQVAECRIGPRSLPWHVCSDLLFERGIGQVALELQ